MGREEERAEEGRQPLFVTLVTNGRGEGGGGPGEGDHSHERGQEQRPTSTPSANNTRIVMPPTPSEALFIELDVNK